MRLSQIDRLNKLRTEYGFTAPTVTRLRGQLVYGLSVTNTGVGTLTTTSRWINFNGTNAPGSILLSSVSMSYLSTMIEIKGMIIPSANGVIQAQIKSSATLGATVINGSYIEVYRIG